MPETPYKGLMPYAEEDAPFFFGREAEREIITANLLASRLTLLYGESGVGKSSLLRAGVASHLRELTRRSMAESGAPESIVVVFNAWRDDPVAGLEAAVREAIAGLFGGAPQSEPERAGRRNLTDTLRHWTELADAELLILLDQFEEYFLYHAEDEGTSGFEAELARVLTATDLRVNVLIAIREDALAKLDRFKGRIPNLFDNYLRIDHLDRDAARAAITGPVAELNRRNPDEPPVSVEPALVEAVLDQVEVGRVLLGDTGRGAVEEAGWGARVETPYLQLVMARLWEEDAGATTPVLRRATLERLGGADRIVRTHLDAVMGALPPAQQEIAARVFRHLVTPSGTKIAHTVSDLADYAGVRPDELVPVLETLSGSGVRILRPVAPPLDRPTEPRYEIFHDVLAAAIADWRSRYARAQEQEQAERRLTAERARVRRLRLGVAALSVLLLAMAGLLVFALRQRAEARDAQSQAQRAESEAVAQQRIATARELSAASLANLDVDPERSILLALQAVRTTTSTGKPALREAEEALHRAIAASRVQLTLRGHTTGLFYGVFSPDGTRAATAGQDGTAKIWDATTGQELLSLPTGRTGSVDYGMGVAFSPDGTRSATTGVDGVARVWDVASGRELLTLRGHSRRVVSVAYSPDGRRMATGSDDLSVKLWDAESGRELLTLVGHAPSPPNIAGEGEIKGLAFSPDGSRLATGSGDTTAKVWDTSTGRELVTLAGHRDGLWSVAFSPDGTQLATASRDGTAKVWDAMSGQPLLTLAGHTSLVTSVAFDPSGTRVFTSSSDGSARAWDAATGQSLFRLAGHIGEVQSVTLSADGGRALTVSRDRTAKVWDVSAAGVGEWLVLAGHSDRIYSLAYSPDGTRLATDSNDPHGLAKVWDAGTGKDLLTLFGHTGRIASIAFSPDGSRLATTSGDGTTRVWSATTGQQLLTLPRGPLYIAFSPDGRRLATGSDRGDVGIWDVISGRELLTLAFDHSGAVLNVAFSPDGKRLATSTEDSTAKVWDATTGRELLTLMGHSSVVRYILFSPDGNLLATGSTDGTAKVWDATTGQELSTLAAGAGNFKIAFSPDGKRLATGTFDGAVKLWDISAGRRRSDAPLTLKVGGAVGNVVFSPDGRRLAVSDRGGTVNVFAVQIDDLLALARTRVTRELTTDECQTYLHQETCPADPRR